MSAIADRIAREHQRVFNRPHATCLCGWGRTYTGDQQPFLCHVAEMTEAALLTAEPTDEEVERAARAIWRWFVGDSLDGFDKHAYAYDREKCMDAARAALRAVRGLA